MKIKLCFISAILLVGCSYIKPYGLNEPLEIAKSKIINCDYEPALDILQQYTVIGSNLEKSKAFEYMSIIYLEKDQQEQFNHTIDRFLFSKIGRSQVPQQVLDKWHKTSLNIKDERFYQLGYMDCDMKNKNKNKKDKSDDHYLLIKDQNK